MNWLKVGAVVVVGGVVLFVANWAINLVFGILSAIVFVAIVGGGIYGVTKLVKAGKRRELRQRPEYYERQQARYQTERESGTRSAAPRPAPSAPAPKPAPKPAQHDVEGELARLKREMGG